MEKVKELFQKHKVIGAIFTTLLVFLIPAFSFVANDASIKKEHTVKIEHIEKTNYRFTKVLDKIVENQNIMKLDIREVKTLMKEKKNVTKTTPVCISR